MRKTLLTVLVTVVFACALNACVLDKERPRGLGVVVKPLTSSAAKDFRPLRVNQVAVYPFEGRSVEENPVKSSQMFTSVFKQQLELRTSLELVQKELKEEDGGLSDSSSAVGGLPLFQRAAAWGKKHGVQGVFCGVVNTFHQSDGNKYGAQEPASVAFRVWLINPENAKVLWTAAYQRTEKPLSENLLDLPRALKDGIKYRSASVLLHQGFTETANALEHLRRPTLAN